MKKILRMAATLILAITLMMVFAMPGMSAKAAGTVTTTWTGTEGDLVQIHEHSIGGVDKGIPIIIMPVHFGSGDIAAGGDLQTAANWAKAGIVDVAETFFTGFSGYFDIYVYLGSDPVSPVPTDGYADSWGVKYSKARELTEDVLGQDPDLVRIVYLGDSNGASAGSVGGYAYGGEGAYLDWGNDGNGNPKQDNLAYWARHEFFGHGFASLTEEYEYPIGPELNAIVNETKPSAGMVPWYDFIGYSETFNGTTYTIDMYTYENPDYHGWLPMNKGFMDDANEFISQYHKWVMYKLANDALGISTSLSAFCNKQGISLNPPSVSSEIDNVFINARKGGTYQLQENITWDNVQLYVQEDFTLDLNGHSITFDYTLPSAAIEIFRGKTFTITDTAGGGTLTVTNTGGAGISTTDATFVVNAGTLDITGGDWGAAIGGCQDCDGGTVIINGGYVTAEEKDGMAAVIGGGAPNTRCGSSESITINGGTVITKGGWYGLGSGCDFGGQRDTSNGIIKITGGSVNVIGDMPMAPTNGSSSEVYLTTVTLDGFANTGISSMTSPSGYGVKDMCADENGKLYLWLPTSTTNLKLTATGNVTFENNVSIQANNDNVVTMSAPQDTEVAVSITKHPSDTSVTAGNTATFSVSASGYPTPTYQWQVSTDNGSNWSNISGATSAKLNVTGTTVDGHNGNQYRCIVKNTTTQENTVTSNAATLTVTQGTGSSGSSGLPNTDAGDMRMMYLLVFLVSAGVFTVAIARKRA